MTEKHEQDKKHDQYIEVLKQQKLYTPAVDRRSKNAPDFNDTPYIYDDIHKSFNMIALDIKNDLYAAQTTPHTMRLDGPRLDRYASCFTDLNVERMEFINENTYHTSKSFYDKVNDSKKSDTDKLHAGGYGSVFKDIATIWFLKNQWCQPTPGHRFQLKFAPELEAKLENIESVEEKSDLKMIFRRNGEAYTLPAGYMRCRRKNNDGERTVDDNNRLVITPFGFTLPYPVMIEQGDDDHPEDDVLIWPDNPDHPMHNVSSYLFNTVDGVERYTTVPGLKDSFESSLANSENEASELGLDGITIDYDNAQINAANFPFFREYIETLKNTGHWLYTKQLRQKLINGEINDPHTFGEWLNHRVAVNGGPVGDPDMQYAAEGREDPAESDSSFVTHRFIPQFEFEPGLPTPRNSAYVTPAVTAYLHFVHYTWLAMNAVLRAPAGKCDHIDTTHFVHRLSLDETIEMRKNAAKLNRSGAKGAKSKKDTKGVEDSEDDIVRNTNTDTGVKRLPASSKRKVSGTRQTNTAKPRKTSTADEGAADVDVETEAEAEAEAEDSASYAEMLKQAHDNRKHGDKRRYPTPSIASENKIGTTTAKLSRADKTGKRASNVKARKQAAKMDGIVTVLDRTIAQGLDDAYSQALAAIITYDPERQILSMPGLIFDIKHQVVVGATAETPISNLYDDVLEDQQPIRSNTKVTKKAKARLTHSDASIRTALEGVTKIVEYVDKLRDEAKQNDDELKGGDSLDDDDNE